MRFHGAIRRTIFEGHARGVGKKAPSSICDVFDERTVRIGLVVRWAGWGLSWTLAPRSKVAIFFKKVVGVVAVLPIVTRKEFDSSVASAVEGVANRMIGR